MHRKTPKSIRVVVVDDSRLMRDGIATMLSRQPDVAVIGTEAVRREAVELVRTTKPHVVLCGPKPGDHDGHRLVAEIRRAAPGVKVIAMNLLPIGQDVIEYVKAGVSGLVPKDAALEEVLGTIRSVAGGADVLSPALTRTLFSYIAEGAGEPGGLAGLDRVRMTKRELEVG
jgi:DNA-binding NarL/FixJ family response regulator